MNLKEPAKFPLEFKEKFKILAQVLTAFLVFYLGPNHWASTQKSLYHLYFDFELLIPLIPWSIIPYCSVYLIPLIVFFKCPLSVIYKIRLALLAQIFIAFIIFIIFPAKLGYSRYVPPGVFSFWYSTLFALDNPHNLLPSLHVGFSFEWSLALIWAYKRFEKWIYFWFFLVCVSVVTTHQHHIMDIVTGIILAISTHFLAIKILEHNKKVT